MLDRSIKTTDDLYQYIVDNDIVLVPRSLPQNKSVSIKEDGMYAIGIDRNCFMDSAEEKTHLAHEIGHCATDSFYEPQENTYTRGRHEYRADKWAVHQLIPFAALKNAIRGGYKERWELAEYFNVTDEFVERTIYIYKCEGKIKA